MESYIITPTTLKIMSVSEFKKITEDYNEIAFVGSKYYLNNFIMKEKQTISHFKEKLELLICFYLKKRNLELHVVLRKLMDSACFFLDLEMVDYILQKGCEVDTGDYSSIYSVPLFRTFIYNYYFVENVQMDPFKKEEMKKIGKLLVQHGAMLEVPYAKSKTKNFVELAKRDKQEQSISYIQAFQPLFNTMQKKQWKKMRLHTIV